jgi:hypothetical protein
VVPERDNPDWRQGYGFQFWRSRHGYRGDGAYGQFMLILPEADAVVAITSQSADMQALLDALWEHLLPALTRGTGPDGRWPAETPSLTGPAGDAGPITDGTFRPGPGNALPALRSAELSGGNLTLTDDGAPLTVRLGEAWTVTGPVAAAVRTQAGRVHADLIFVETPHRLHLVLDPGATTVEARWETVPLHDRPLADTLAETRSPAAGR